MRGLIILAMVLPSTLKTPHDYRKKSTQEIEAERKKRKQYENYYRTGTDVFFTTPISKVKSVFLNIIQACYIWNIKPM